MQIYENSQLKSKLISKFSFAIQPVRAIDRTYFLRLIKIPCPTNLVLVNLAPSILRKWMVKFEYNNNFLISYNLEFIKFWYVAISVKIENIVLVDLRPHMIVKRVVKYEYNNGKINLKYSTIKNWLYSIYCYIFKTLIGQHSEVCID